MLAALKNLFSPSPVRQQAYHVYAQVVEQARQPVFYQQWQVEDTLDGRFDVIVMHLFLVITRLAHAGGHKDAQALSRHLSEAFFSDMDRSLREMGVTDTGVSIRIKKMAQAFYGRMKAYKEAMGDEKALAGAIKRNVYRDRQVAPEIPASLAAYMGRNDRVLAQQSVEALQYATIPFSG